jgi:NADPH-dependent 2,4-dienoyl-CoA reductase/sulfur reductase-like enzyme
VLRTSQAIKESGAKIIVCPNGGFRDPDLNNGYIADGKTDMIAMARAFIADWEYGKKIYDGRGEDVAPCIMCNKCHGLSMKGPWFSVCSVNPELGVSSAVQVIKAPTTRKNVAVIGGGPAGMKAAVTAAERGHSVTLYEKNDFLGGLLRHADFSTFKWPLKDFKDYLVRQTYKAGVQVLLGTEATPDMIRGKGYDVVLAAVGAAPVLPRLPGVEGDNVWDIEGVYGNEAALGKHVVLVGGGEYGVETGMHLAACGHRVTVLTSGMELLRVDRVHYPEIVIDAYEHLENFDYVTGAVATGISNGKVAYVDAGGATASVKADDVVVYTGLRPRQDEALSFSGAAGNAFFVIGDCTGRCGDVQKAIRNAYFAAAQI